MAKRGYLLLIVMGTLVTSCAGFLCRLCSFSATSDSNEDCIYDPRALHGPNNVNHCNRSCFVQENFSIEKQQVDSYTRTCNSVEKSGYCVKDTWNIVCYFSCLGEFCSDAVGILHEIYPVMKQEDVDSQFSSNSSSGRHWVSTVIIFVLVKMCLLNLLSH